MDKFNLDKLEKIAKPRSEEAINKADERKTKARIKALVTKLRCVGKQGSTETERYVDLNTEELKDEENGRLYCQLVYFADNKQLAVYWLDENNEGEFIDFADLSQDWQVAIAKQVYVM